MTEEQPQPVLPWDRQPGEPAKWYYRFNCYMIAGPGRSIEQTYRLEKAGRSGKHVPGSWRDAASEYRWIERAAAWDAKEVSRFRCLHADAIEKDRQIRLEACRKMAELCLANIERLSAQLDPKTLLVWLMESTKLRQHLLMGDPSQQPENTLTRIEQADVNQRLHPYVTAVAGILGAIRSDGPPQPVDTAEANRPAILVSPAEPRA